MADRSFKEYIGSRFYDQFFNAIKSYVIQNRHNIELNSHTVSSADYAELSDFEIKSVGIDDRDGMGIAFDVLVEAEVYVKEHHRHRDVDEDTCFPWFILSCTADLSRNMDDLCIHRIDQYNQRNKQNKPLSDSLVPISYKIDLDKIATEFLRKHYPEALRTPMPVDPTVLADRLGLSVVTQELTEDFSVFGQIFFQDCDTEVFNSDTGEMEPAHFPAKTIVVDPKAFHLRNLGSVNNTIVHGTASGTVHYQISHRLFSAGQAERSNHLFLQAAAVCGGCYAEGAVSTLSQTVSGFKTRIENAEGSVSTLTQTVNSFKTRIETAEGNITSVTQTANKINWLVKSGTSASDFTMTDRAVKLVADKIDLSGYVTISALSTAGKTTINGANITTGTIHADRIDTSTLKVKTIYSQSGKVSLKEYTSSTMYIGGDGTWNYDYTYIFAGTQIKLASWDGVGTHALVIDTKNHCVRPATIVDWDLGNISYTFGNVWCEKITIRNGNNDGYIGFNGGTFEIVANGAAVNRLGSSTYYWDTGYISKLYLSGACYLDAYGTSLRVNGTVIGGSDPNMAGKEVKMGGSTSYYITASTSRELKPSNSSTTYPFYLGTASYYWHYAYLGSVMVKIGSGSSSKIGFFAGTPIARQTLSSTTQNMSYSTATSSNYLKIATMNEEIQVIAGLVSQCIKENATTQQSQEEYTEKYNRLVKRYEKAVSQLNKATADRESRMQRDRELRIFIGSIKEKPLVLETWDEGLWITLLETATVHADNRITFRFKDGTDIEVGAE